ncbi:uncharacterized protein LOC126336585 [Schistocerca gregaria]|uniref:uncharacterized protein LOC126336585 n=1 Tax=Schistocerca gregaria TaxID=7010 RepID=UPI00211EDC48|nr:uncharacterized protein LOC126336585 [Schistocerca gregaria]
MMKSLVVALLLAVSGSVAQYPRYEEVVRNPKDPDLLYGSKSGPHNETWYFKNSGFNLTSIVIPSQVNVCSPGTSTNVTYEEAVDLFLYETKLDSTTSRVQTYLKASGSFSGIVSYGQELDIPLWNATINGAPLIHSYISDVHGHKYTLKIVFKTSGIYPWYTTRILSTFSPIHTLTNGVGIAIGLSYIIP